MDFGLKLDALSLMMLLVVTGVGGAIHIYSYGYMDEDRSKSRFFAELSLFTFSMLGIVLANNFLMMFIFWELVGVSSYLLIGFWFEKPSAGDAAKKAFITNRLGDFGFLAGHFDGLGFARFAELFRVTGCNRQFKSRRCWEPRATIAGLLVFCGAVGKSAQFPLHVWLPDAMEGPTPVSALIHAATMVAAGVYMLCRTLFLYNADALHVIAYIGGFTALLAALIAVQQNDIKRIIAYSTLSQLGYMVMAVGLNGPTPAMFHLTTHAFFKALLFLERRFGHPRHAPRAGHLADGQPAEENARHVLDVPRRCAGVERHSAVQRFLLEGFHFRAGVGGERIILMLPVRHAVFVAGLTAFYTFRLFFVVFFGKEKSDHAKHAHESPLIITAAAVDSGHICGHRRFHRHHEQLRFAIRRRPRNAFVHTTVV